MLGGNLLQRFKRGLNAHAEKHHFRACVASLRCVVESICVRHGVRIHFFDLLGVVVRHDPWAPEPLAAQKLRDSNMVIMFVKFR